MTARSVSVLALLVAACAAWETTSPSLSSPPVETPTPSHHAPPAEPPAEPPQAEPTPEPTPTATPTPASPVNKLQVAIASVQLLEDCPDPAPAAAPAAEAEAPKGPAGAALRSSQADAPEARSQMKVSGGSYQRMCSQSTVQLSVVSDGVGQFKVEEVRVLAAHNKKRAGTTALREPTGWNEANGVYGAWDERTVVGELKVSYKMGALDLSTADKLVGDKFNTYSGPFMLELVVSVDGKRRTIRSPEFSREPPHVMVT